MRKVLLGFLVTVGVIAATCGGGDRPNGDGEQPRDGETLPVAITEAKDEAQQPDSNDVATPLAPTPQEAPLAQPSDDDTQPVTAADTSDDTRGDAEPDAAGKESSDDADPGAVLDSPVQVEEPDPIEAQPSSPLPEWLDVVEEFTVARASVPADQRMLVATGCTHCGGGGGPLRTWMPQDGYAGLSSRTLLPVVSNVRIAAGGDVIALLQCDRFCPAHGGASDLTPTLYVSLDGGVSWQETALPRGFWDIEELRVDGTATLVRGEAPADAIEGEATDITTALRVERIDYPSMTILPESSGPPPGRVGPIFAADGSRWWAADPSGSEHPATALFRDGTVVRDFWPYRVQELVTGPAGERLIVLLECGVRRGFPFDCHPDLLNSAFLFEYRANGTERGGYEVRFADFRPQLDPPTTLSLSDAPTFRDMTWMSSGLLVGSIQLSSPLTIRPVVVNIDQRVVRAFVEPDAAFAWVAPVKYGPAPASQPARVSSALVDCLYVRPLPRIDEVHNPIACLSAGTPITLSGESATDAAGGEWLFVLSEPSGWVSAPLVERVEKR